VRAFHAAGALALVALVLQPVLAAADDVFTPTQDPAAGEILFATKGCVRCHAANGEGPDLRQMPRPRSAYDVAAAMWNHLPQMGARLRAVLADKPYLTPNEMSDLVAFLAAPGPAGGLLPDGLGDPQRGKRLIADKRCLSCHSLTPPRGRSAESLSPLKGPDSPWTIMAMLWNHGFLMAVTPDDPRAGWPRLTAGELADVVAFLRVHGYARSRPDGR